MDFLKQILNGKKRLLKLKDVKQCNFLPRFYEIDTKLIWNEVKVRQDIKSLFPESFVTMKRIPYRTYLFS